MPQARVCVAVREQPGEGHFLSGLLSPQLEEEDRLLERLVEVR